MPAEGETFNDYVSCPYNEAHKVLRGRLTIHLDRCKRNSGHSTRLLTCPFNENHRIVLAELQDHIKVCKNRAVVEKFINVDKQPPTAAAATERPCLVECQDNWDDEPDVPSYNPFKHCENNLVVRSRPGQGQSRAVRQNIRQQERRRFAEMNNPTKK